MNEFINTHEFAKFLFDDNKLATQAGYIIRAMLDAQSPRLSDISHHMPGNPDANYKAIQRFLEKANPKDALMRLYQEDASFIIGDPTEIERPHAKRTSYVGVLKDGTTPGFWLLMLATPFRGRSIPFDFITYSSKTIADEASSRNLEHFEALLDLKNLIGEKPIVLDREFSYGLLLENLVAANIHFVIRLRMGSKPPIFLNDEGRQIKLRIAQDSKKVIYRQLYYQGKIAVNLVGIWSPGYKQPLWVMTDLEPEQGLDTYKIRSKIEQSFRDLKRLLNLDKLMNKSQANMEKIVSMMLITYTVGVLVGEAIRDEKYPPETDVKKRASKRSCKQWKTYSGLHILLKQKIDLSTRVLRRLVREVLNSFKKLVWGDVRTFV